MKRTSRWKRVAIAPLAALASNLAPGLQGDPGALHAARVASRRARALAAILRPGLGHRRYRKLSRKLRRVTSFLGRVRELDVSLALIDELQAEGPNPYVHELKAALIAERQEALATAAQEAGAETAARLLERLSARLDRLERDKFVWTQAAGSELDVRARALTAAVNRARVFYDAGRLHRARVALKRFRYVVELVSEARARPVRRQLAVLRRTQDLLGRMHDLDVLVLRLRGADGHAEKAAAKLETEARNLHAEYVSLRPRLVAAIKECRRRLTASDHRTTSPRAAGRRRAGARMASAQHSHGRVA